MTDQLNPSMDFFSFDGSVQGDKVRIQNAQIVKKWFRQYETWFSHMDWAPQSPDLNPIKNLWDAMEKTFNSFQLCHHQYKTLVNKSGDTAEAFQNNSTMNASCNQS